MGLLDRLQLVEQRVEGAVGDLWVVEDVVAVVVVLDEPAQLGRTRGAPASEDAMELLGRVDEHVRPA